MTSNMRIRATAGVVLRNADGQVLLMRRRFEDTWGLPGGGVEPGESMRHFVGVVFLASAVERDGTPDGEASELRWATAEDLPAPLFAPDIPVLHDAFAPDLRRPVIN